MQSVSWVHKEAHTQGQPTPSIGGALAPMLTHSRKNSYYIYCPDAQLASRQIARALSQQYPTIASGVQLIPTEDSFLFQSLDPGLDLSTLLRDGLDLDGVHADVLQMHYVSTNSTIVELSFKNVLVGKDYKSQLQSWCRGYGSVLDDFVCVFGGTQMHTGEVRVVLETNAAAFLPPAILKQEHIGYTTDVTCDVVGNPAWCCDACRSTLHNSLNCPAMTMDRPEYRRSRSAADVGQFVRQGRGISSTYTSPANTPYATPLHSPYASPLPSPAGSPHLRPTSMSYGWRPMTQMQMTPSIPDERASSNMFGLGGTNYPVSGQGWPSGNYCTY